MGYSWSDMGPLFEKACTWVGSVKPAVLFLVGHWNGSGMGCPSGMDDESVYNRVKALPGCSGVPFKYIEGHAHCNTLQTNGVMLGSFGFSGCGDYGIPVVDTRNNKLKLYYFEMASHGNKNGNFDAFVRCLESKG